VHSHTLPYRPVPFCAQQPRRIAIRISGDVQTFTGRLSLWAN